MNAGTSARGRVIVAFEELPEDVAEQTLPIGGKKSDLNLPEELDVLLYSEDAEKEDRKKETVSKDRTDDTAETPTEAPADEKQSEEAAEPASEEGQGSIRIQTIRTPEAQMTDLRSLRTAARTETAHLRPRMKPAQTETIRTVSLRRAETAPERQERILTIRAAD